MCSRIIICISFIYSYPLSCRAKVFENSPDSCIIGDDNSFKIGVVYDESVTYQIIEAATDILGNYIVG